MVLLRLLSIVLCFAGMQTAHFLIETHFFDGQMGHLCGSCRSKEFLFGGGGGLICAGTFVRMRTPHSRN